MGTWSQKHFDKISEVITRERKRTVEALSEEYVEKINMNLGDNIVKTVKDNNGMLVGLRVGEVLKFYSRGLEIVAALEIMDLLARETKVRQSIRQEQPDIELG